LNHTKLLSASQKASGYTVQEFASKVGVSRHAFYKWGRQNYVPENRREAVAELSLGHIAPEMFQPKFYEGKWR